MSPTKRNNEDRKSFTLKEIARLVGGEISGDPDIVITGVAGIKEAGEGEITFLSNPKYLSHLDETSASAVITSKDVRSGKNLVHVSNPSQAFTAVLSAFAPPRSAAPAGIHPSAVIDASARLEKPVSVGAHVVIEAETSVGAGSSIGANVFIGARCIIGKNAVIYPNVTVREETEIGDNVIIHSGTVIGSYGFGYETVDGVHLKIPQVGSVKIEDDVEIGANVCIDRGRFQKTWIKKGTKIDNLVQIAHNVVVGPNCLLVSQCGISGSSELGKNVILAGQVGVVGHVTLGDDVIVGAQAGVTKSVPEKSVILGSPAKPISEQKKIIALISRLPELFHELAQLKKKVSGEKPVE